MAKDQASDAILPGNDGVQQKGSSVGGPGKPEKTAAPGGGALGAGPVAILGGTGQLGMGLALRWARAGIPILIGSRDRERAAAAAHEVIRQVPGALVEGMENGEAARRGEAVVVSVPFAAQEGTLRPLEEACRGKPVLDAMVPLAPGDPTRLDPPSEGSSAQRTAALLAGEARVVSGFHTVAAGALQRLEKPVEGDVLLCGDDPGAKSLFSRLAEAAGMRPVDCGPLENAQTLERLTPLIIGLNRRYRRRQIGIRLTGLPGPEQG